MPEETPDRSMRKQPGEDREGISGQEEVAQRPGGT